MRLAKAEISGFGRLADAKVNLDNKVIAVVGPNEAGKTTLLKALAYIDNDASLPVPERSRGLGIADGHTVVRVQYLLDDTDRASVAEFELEEPPRSLWLSRAAAGGGIELTVEPEPRKSAANLLSVITALRKVTTSKALSQLDAPESDDQTDVDEARQSLRTRVEALADGLAQQSGADAAREVVSSDAQQLTAIADMLRTEVPDSPLLPALDDLIAWLRRDDPAQAVADRLYKRSPDILLFEDADRSLASSYTLTDEVMSDPPAALANLCAMADLSLQALSAAMASGDDGERETLIHAANQVLQAKFKQAWKQSDLTAHLKIEVDRTLSVRIMQDGKRITQFEERSAGLRMFVALVAFLAARRTQRPPVLLIDEAETHLHIDAQQDLINTFMTQTEAAKIIYTTHSPACLPPDLGSNIRAVLPDESNPTFSRIEGSFWHNAAGYSPLMLAMGAGAAAFSAARFVVLAEGASEMLLLPSLIRHAVDVDDLEYQVAPGLSEIPTAMYPELDLEGARVAYLVDGDGGGKQRRQALIDGGVPADRIVTLAALTLENLLDAEAYLKTVRALLGEANGTQAVPDLPALPAPDSGAWPTALEHWAKENRLKLPGKRVVASRLVEDGLAIPSATGVRALKQVHQEIGTILRARTA